MYSQQLIILLLYCVCCICTPLDDYVNKPDSTYQYVDTGNPDKMAGYIAYYINLTSQTWLTDADVDRSVWWHYLVIMIPDKIQITDTAFLYITGGSNTDKRPDQGGEDCLLTSLLSLSTGSVTAVLFQVPNEHIIFKDDPTRKSRGEDSIIAYTWYHFIKNQGRGPEWLLRLPMTKAAVRAMDTVTDFVAKKNSSLNIAKFVVGGASKRGWTTWTTGAVDKRVIAIVPIVMDLLKMVKNLHHHYRSLGGWTFAFDDYVDLNITANLDSPYTQQLADVVDPYSYIDRLSMPKFMVCTGGDEFFLNDDSQFYWNEFVGDKYIRTIPNCEHSVAGHTISLELDIRAFYLSVVLNYPRPKLTWTMSQTSNGGMITLITDTKPLDISVYHATTLDGKRRDFRLLVKGDDGKAFPHPVIWFNTSITSKHESPGNYQYTASMNNPDVGWRAFLIQATFKGPHDSVFQWSTQVNIIPNTFPFPECHGEGCRGVLV